MIDKARAAFLRACALDVAVRKPGNVSWAAPGHGMQAGQFIAAAEAAAGPLFTVGHGVGQRLEEAVAASWSAAGCNTNLGILLLCAPIACAAERLAGPAASRGDLQDAVQAVLAGLTVDDAQGAFRAIALANPGGLGRAPSQDVHRPPSIDLRSAMALAAERDFIARQYRDGYRDLFEVALDSLPYGFTPSHAAVPGVADAATVDAVQRLYLRLLSRFVDSHIVRKHGLAVAQNVMRAAQAWMTRSAEVASLDDEPEFAAWDLELKLRRVNPGTTADLTVATLLLAALAPPSAAPTSPQWHET